MNRPVEASAVGAFLVLTCLAVYAPSLSSVPVGDDLRLLSRVATAHPVSFFTGDWGLGGEATNYYRPLHLVSLWVTYQLFGVAALPGQLLNLALHSLNAWILFGILRRVEAGRTLALTLTTLFLVSIYTVSSATWVSDRPTLLVGLCLLLLVRHWQRAQLSEQPPHLALLAGLSMIAMLAKESGLIVPAVALALVIHPTRPRNDWRSAAVLGLLMAGYLALRIALFGSEAFLDPSYADRPLILLGGEQLNASDGMLAQAGAKAETVAKNTLAPALPVFNGKGLIFPPRTLLVRSTLWVPTLFLFLLSCRRRPSSLQSIALLIVLTNAVAHYSIFRYRVLYVGELALCLFVASSPALLESVRRRRTAIGLAVCTLVGSVYWANGMQQVTLEYQRELLTTYRDSGAVAGVDPETLRRVLESGGSQSPEPPATHR